MSGDRLYEQYMKRKDYQVFHLIKFCFRQLLRSVLFREEEIKISVFIKEK
jgi:hypothetical protein